MDARTSRPELLTSEIHVKWISPCEISKREARTHLIVRKT